MIDEIAAEQLYVQATALDPRFALAYARASLLNSGSSVTAMTGSARRKRAPRRRKLCGYRQPWAKRIWP